MPKNNVIAEDGTYVSPEANMINYYMNYWDNIRDNALNTNSIQNKSYDRSNVNIGRMNTIKVNNITPYNYYKTPDSSYEIINNAQLSLDDSYKRTPTNNGNNKSFFDKYNTSLGISALSNAGLNIGNAIANYQAIQRNKKEQPPESLPQVSYSPIAYKYLQTQPYLRQLERGYNFANRFARQSGSPELTTNNLSNYFNMGQGMISNINQQNLQGATSVAQMNQQGQLAAEQMNIQSKVKDIENRFRHDTMMSQIQSQNLQNIYNSMQAGINLGGQYSQNKLSSDIMADLYGKISPQLYAELMLKRYGQQ